MVMPNSTYIPETGDDELEDHHGTAVRLTDWLTSDELSRFTARSS